MENQERIVFTKQMKGEYTILVPTMLPTHFGLIINVLNEHGYNAKLLENKGKNVVDSGLKYVHNDTCYPALLVIGQMLDAIESGDYDKNKIAFLITQTGGGCRASNYIHLLRKALKKSGYDYIPVISLNFNGMEKNPGFVLTLPMLHRMFYCVLYGDLFMLIGNQTRAYEIEKGATDKLIDKWAVKLANEMKGRGFLSYRRVKNNYRKILEDFNAIPIKKTDKVKVGIVGEIFVKFSPLGNNNLEEFLLAENAEIVMPGLLDFCMYCVYNGISDHNIYGKGGLGYYGNKIGYWLLTKKQAEMIECVKEYSEFRAATEFEHTRKMVEEYIGYGTKMGEGWLLTAEMVELIDQGINNIVCTQPFGCLPNHIVGKGKMKMIKERHPQANIVAVDYDPGATKINQENRVKLMLANAMKANAVKANVATRASVKAAVFNGKCTMPEENEQQEKLLEFK